MNETLFSEGLTLLSLGMGFVFLFLLFLVLMTTLMSKIIIRFTPIPIVVSDKASAPPATPDDDELIAVLTAAIHQHQKTRVQHNLRG
ncbi:OadG family protein [Celerinatantimonas yamalensis]|uniref:Probable oxaloacetate decarboxylase gamma chain n=1 Tax=Celerinatantimonas yamalensis TaxID=559956 RepID=A0ABW9G452_9GAMM